jgi:hypothetical protein
MRFANGLRRAHFIAGLFAIASTELLVASSASGQSDGFRIVTRLPPAMVDACKGSSAGDDCTVALKDHTINGTCRAWPTADTPLACVPKDEPGMSPPLDACKDRAAGSSCSLIFGDRPIDGTCSADTYLGGQLVCRPNQKP